MVCFTILGTKVFLIVRDGIEWSVYDFGWFADKGVLTEKHVLRLRATFLD